MGVRVIGEKEAQDIWGDQDTGIITTGFMTDICVLGMELGIALSRAGMTMYGIMGHELFVFLLLLYTGFAAVCVVLLSLQYCDRRSSSLAKTLQAK